MPPNILLKTASSQVGVLVLFEGWQIKNFCSSFWVSPVSTMLAVVESGLYLSWIDVKFVPAWTEIYFAFTAVGLSPAAVLSLNEGGCSTRILNKLSNSVPERCPNDDNALHVNLLSICRPHGTGFVNDLHVDRFQSTSRKFRFSWKYRPGGTIMMKISV